MKHFFSIVLVSGLLVNYSFSQEKTKKAEIVWSDNLKVSQDETFSGVIGKEGTGVFVLSSRSQKNNIMRTEHTIRHYDANMKEVNSADLNLDYQNKYRDLELVFQYKKEIFIVASQNDKEHKQKNLYLQKLNKKTLQLEPDIKKIDAIDYSGHSRFNSGSFYFKISRDSSTLAIMYNLPYELGGKERFGFNVFDAELNPIWNKDIELPYNDKLFTITNFILDINGNIHLLGKIFENKRDKTAYKHHIISYYNGGKEVREYPVHIPDKYLTDMNIAVNDDLDILCTGFYSEKGIRSIKGSYFLKINKETKKILIENFMEFDKEFMLKNLSKRDAKYLNVLFEKNRNPEMKNYHLDDMVLKDDGGVVLIGEQFYQDGTTSAGNKYFYNHIIVINIQPNGMIEWAQKIPKKQLAIGDSRLLASYAMMVRNDKLYFVFYDSQKNLTDNGEKIYDWKSSMGLILVELDGNDGNYTKELLATYADSKTYLWPKRYHQISKNDMMLHGKYMRNLKFGKLRILD